MVAMLNRSYVEQDPRFRVAAEFRDGRSALSWLSLHPVDLVILDVFMPAMTGFELLRELRRREIPVDAVMVTAANDARTLDQCLKLGVVDYLVKPFTMQRFRQALEKFCQFRRAVPAEGSVSQNDIDKLFAASPEGETAIPKGLQEKTMERIREFLTGVPEQGLTSEEVAAKAGLSAVTARRYLNHMLETGEVASRINYDTGGRPSVAYHLSNARRGR
jgi:response regulator of citrate/malate metabolism